MTQNSQPLDVEEALSLIVAKIAPLTDRTQVPLSEAKNAVLAEPVIAPIDLPPFPASAMDGYAIRSQDFVPTGASSNGFSVKGASMAGHPYTGTVGASECVRIFTGAAIPQGADMILLQEDLQTTAGNEVTFKADARGESFIRPIGHDTSKGTLLGNKGDQVDAFLHGTLAANGIAQVTVAQKPIVGVFSSGDELVNPTLDDAKLRPGQIFDSNRVTVMHLLDRVPCSVVDLGCLPDQAEIVRERIEQASRDCDVLITSGGVSVGDADFITETIAALGTLEFWKLNLKPGKPLALGHIGDCTILGLPGNPVSTIVTLLIIAIPVIQHLGGAKLIEPLKVPAKLTQPVQHKAGRVEYQRGTLAWIDGELTVNHTGDQSSNRLQTFTEANCIFEIPKSRDAMSPGEQVLALPFRGLL